MAESTSIQLSERFGKSLLTRDQGARVRKELHLLVKSCDSVAINFQGVSEMTPSFADEAFGRLLLELGPTVFKQKVLLKSATVELRRLVNYVLAHREKEKKDQDGSHKKSA